MSVSGWGLTGALVLGFLTALQPCALALTGGGAAWSLGWGGGRAAVFRRGLLLVLGLCLAYALLAFIAAHLAISLAGPALRVAAAWEPFQGPLFLAAGALVCGVFGKRERLRLPSISAGNNPLLTGLTLLVAFALAFLICPSTSGIFFLLVIPAAIAAPVPTLYAAFYGLGLALPLLAVVCLYATARPAVDKTLRMTGRMQSAAGVLLMVLGGWRIARMVFRLWL